MYFILANALGDLQPSRVRADVSVTLNLKKDVQEEWENLRKHDVCFLLTVKPILPIGKKTFLLKRESAGMLLEPHGSKLICTNLIIKI